ncbi:HdaA/DnaA family protein [Arenibaculum pallidiluteum]|uniref:HdaA/DnaA family protein n=1 Tax=Arenibaculum pallidiluteum TaxID=2812559 RepID=UPI001A97C878|nr:DnaA/Hda family protein [Arenibaculum pallidiluteum]
MSAPAQLPLDLGHRPAMEADDFLVAPENAEAVAWLDRWPAWPAPALVIHGPPGCGKTHLAQVWRARSHAPLLRGSAVAGADLPALIAQAGAVALDDAEAVAGNRAAERALFHLYNLARESGGTLLLTAAKPPSRWRIRLPDLRSRLRAAPAVGVSAPDDSLLALVLVKLFADRQVRIGADLVDYLLPRMERSFEAARRLVDRLDREALARQRPITLRLARAVLAGEEGPID